MNVSVGGKPGVTPPSVPPGLSVDAIANVSALPCVSEFSATVTMTWASGAREVNVTDSALKLARDAPSPVLLKSKVTESSAIISVGSKEITATLPSGMTR